MKSYMHMERMGHNSRCNGIMITYVDYERNCMMFGFSRCHPDDKFNTGTGIRNALDRAEHLYSGGILLIDTSIQKEIKCFIAGVKREYTNWVDMGQPFPFISGEEFDTFIEPYRDSKSGFLPLIYGCDRQDVEAYEILIPRVRLIDPTTGTWKKPALG